ncbi:hypothetical protein LFL97_31960 [Burkholderia sp. JSH-S8]|nr:hypothetical protein LFL97_31960 [Burkholderia sp. JSH-S8]
MKKTTGVIVACIIVAVAASATLAYRSHARSTELSAMRPAINTTNAYLSQILQADVESSSMTFGEFYSKADKAISEIDAKTIELKSLELARTDEERQAAISYMQDVQEIIRGESHKYHNMAELYSSSDYLQDAVTDMKSATSSDNQYSYQYAKERADRALKRAQNAAKDVDNSKAELVKALQRVRMSAVKTADTLSIQERPVADIDQAIKRNAPTPNILDTPAASEVRN